MLKSFWVLKNNYDIASRLRVIGIRSVNPAQVLIGLILVFSFYYFFTISGIHSSSAATIEETITVGEGPIALAFNPSDDNLYVATETSGSVSVIQP